MHTYIKLFILKGISNELLYRQYNTRLDGWIMQHVFPVQGQDILGEILRN